MGDPPPDISSILAALAAQQQRPNAATPLAQALAYGQSSGAFAQPQQPSMLAGIPGLPGLPGLPGYAAGYPLSHPALALGGFQLPQPSNSGSVDLSGIKPISTGQGIAEAIAKARSIAAEKGIGYDIRQDTRASDPRLAGGYRRSRSRSPPPARRENFRDNYNPYREERREDRRGAGGIGSGGAGGGRDFRERSFSPGLRDRRGGLDTFSPTPGRGYGGRSPRANFGAPDGDNVETIQIDASLVGLIIGRQGENLRRVESETGARVQFITDSTGGQNRPCKISGSRAAREQAKGEIFRIVEENGRAGAGSHTGRSTRDEANSGTGAHQPALRDGEDAMQIMVPDRTVGLIIGRGGETIRDLQEKSGCHVNIVGESKSVSGLRPVNLIGSVQAAAMAKELIMEIVDSDTKSLAAQGAGMSSHREPQRGGGDGSYGSGGFGGSGPGQVAGRINDSIRVPSEAVGMIIGKGGETIKEMQSVSGCKINVSQTSGPGETDREIGLVGTRDSIEQAKRLIDEKVEFVRSGGTRRPPRDDYRQDTYNNNDRSSQMQQQQQQQQQQALSSAYGQSSGGLGGYGQPYNPQAATHAQSSVLGASVNPTTGTTAAATTAVDPYAIYGGYQNYAAMYYAAQAAAAATAAQAAQGGDSSGKPSGSM